VINILTPQQLKNFWAKIDKKGPDDCWLWTAARTSIDHTVNGGYGQFGAGKLNHYTSHKLMWLLIYGPIPDNKWVLHKCPLGSNSLCCNPSHLYLGTDKENKADMMREGRHGTKNHPETVRGENNGRAKMTKLDVIEIRRRKRLGEKDEDVAKNFGITKGAVWFISTGRTWKSVR
jgi:hypothetical protein